MDTVSISKIPIERTVRNRDQEVPGVGVTGIYLGYLVRVLTY